MHMRAGVHIHAHMLTPMMQRGSDLVTSRPKLLTQAMAKLPQEVKTGWEQACVLPHTGVAVLWAGKVWTTGGSRVYSDSHCQEDALSIG